MGLTAAEAAEILGVTPQSVYRLVHQGKLAKPERFKNAGLERETVEQFALGRLKPGRTHRYWLTVRQAAGVLNVSPTRVRQLANAGRIPGVPHNGKWFFRRHQMEVVANAREARRWASA